MDSKLLGGILLIVGTSIGAGMLALPLTTASLGFFGSVALLLGCWALMTYAAFLVLEVNLWMPQNSNLITMAKTTLGKPGQVVAWISTVVLLYSILCAYISGGSDLMHHLIVKKAYDLPVSVSAILFTLIFGGVIYLGIRAVDYVNRFMMFIKLASYILLIILLMPLVSTNYLKSMDLHDFKWMLAIMVSITSFGYANIIPSLRIYFHSDVAKLKKAIFIGSLIPLICYIFWDAVIMGVIPIDKPLQTTSDLVNALTSMASSSSVAVCVKTFTSICVVTSFLGVGLSLTDFLADGFHLSNEGGSKVFITFLAFVPPLAVALFFPNIFVTALHYAGVNCVVLFIGLPALMTWFGRYRVHVHQGFRAIGGKGMLGFIIVLSLILVVKGLTF